MFEYIKQCFNPDMSEVYQEPTSSKQTPVTVPQVSLVEATILNEQERLAALGYNPSQIRMKINHEAIDAAARDEDASHRPEKSGWDAGPVDMWSSLSMSGCDAATAGVVIATALLVLL